MNWKSILPKGIKIHHLSFDECRNFKHFYQLITQDISGPDSFKIFYQFLHHALFFMLCCIEENKYPALNQCRKNLQPLFGTSAFDNEWFLYCWMLCNFPLKENTDHVLLDDFEAFIVSSETELNHVSEQIQEFCKIMKSSRLGLYQECLSSQTKTTFKELFTNITVNTIRSVPYYESGEIFVTRLVAFLGDTFQIHHPQCYPAQYKNHLITMVENKLFYISETDNISDDYDKFMRLAGPYWMSCTHPDASVQILMPDHYESFY